MTTGVGEFQHVLLIGTDGVPYEVSSGGVSQADGSAFTPNTSSVAPIGGLYEATPTSVNDGDVGALGMTASRVLKAALHDAVGAAITTLPVSLASVPSHAVTNAGTFAVQAAGDVAHDDADSGNPVKIGGKASSSAPTNVAANDRVNMWLGISGAPVMGAFGTAGADGESNTGGFLIGSDGNVRSLTSQPRMYNGSTWDRIRGDSSNGLLVNLGSNNDVTVTGSLTTVSTVSALGTGTTGPMKAEDVAHSTGDMGIPAWGVRQDTPNATAAASNDYHYLATDMVGGIRTALYETDFAVLGTNHVKKYYTNAGAVTDGIVWSPAAGKRWYVTDLIINVSAAATVTFEDDKAGGDEAVMKFELAANSGIAHSFATPWFSGEDAADLIVTTSAGNVYITVTGYEI